MNAQMNLTVKAAIVYLKAFEQSMRVSAMKDDGLVDREEEKALKKLGKLTDKYIKELERLMD